MEYNIITNEMKNLKRPFKYLMWIPFFGLVISYVIIGVIRSKYTNFSLVKHFLYFASVFILNVIILDILLNFLNLNPVFLQWLTILISWPLATLLFINYYGNLVKND